MKLGCDKMYLSSAAKYGNIEVVKWLVSLGIELNDNIFYHAGKSGNIKLLQWLKNKGCPWSRSTPYGAAIEGNLETLIWLKDNGCPFQDEMADDLYIELEEENRYIQPGVRFVDSDLYKKVAPVFDWLLKNFQ